MCDLVAVSSPLDERSAPIARVRRGAARRSWWVAGLPLVLVLMTGAAYGFFFVVPYYVNDLDRFSLNEVASGAHDPKDLWPYQDGGVRSVIWGFGGLFTFMLGPFVAYVAPLWAAFVMWRDRRVLRVREWCALVITVVCGATLLMWLDSPFGSALMGWWLD